MDWCECECVRVYREKERERGKEGVKEKVRVNCQALDPCH